MNYVIYKLYFLNGVHFGNNSLESSAYTFCADTLFSALCLEAAKMGEDRFTSFYTCVKEHQLLFSDAFPFRGNQYYLPKPFLYIDYGDNTGDSTIKKAYKKMKYISCDHFEQYLKGLLSPEQTHGLNEFGYTYQKVSASIRGEKETVPYRTGVFYYREGNGVYIIAGTETPTAEKQLDELLDSLSYSGIGGKRSSGLGRFTYHKVEIPKLLTTRLTGNWTQYMTLSLSLPRENELTAVISEANYSLIKRSGFVASEHYAEEQLRKNDLYVFSAGSCFHRKYEGDIFDVSNYGRHPVYRYAVPMFMGVDI